MIPRNQSVFHGVSFVVFVSPFLILGHGAGKTFSTSSECALFGKLGGMVLPVWVGYSGLVRWRF